MKLKSFGFTSLLLALIFLCSSAMAADLTPLKLPSPQMDGGKPLMQALKDRMSSREYSDRKLSEQTLSNMLWAAFGISRADGRRTAPSAKNWQEMDIYVVLPEGAYLWDHAKNVLNPVASGDLRGLTGTQAYVKDAAVNLVYVADYAKAAQPGSLETDILTAADTGFISENVYLFCASEGLGTVIRASIDRPALAKALKLRTDQKITLSQSVGYPKK